MTTTSTEDTTTKKENLAQLIQRCTELCQTAEKAVDGLSTERAAFLSDSLDGALQQLEVILRVLGESSGQTGGDRQNFLRRMFGGSTNSDSESGDQPETPSFEVSSLGLQGNSWTVAIPELLGFLAFSYKTGILWVDSPTENFLVGVVDGRLMHASSDHTPEGLRLGEVLVGLGYLTRRQLERFLNAQGDGVAVSGEMLLENGLISDVELHEALTNQVSQLFSRLINTRDAVFRFQEGLNVQLAYQVDLDINQLLLNSTRVYDEDANSVQLAASVLSEWNEWKDAVEEQAGNDAPEGESNTATNGVPKAKPAPKKEEPVPAAAKFEDGGDNADKNDDKGDQK